MIGKEIVRFHCVYWPALLMAAGLAVAAEDHGARMAAVRRKQDVEVARQHRAHGDDSRCAGRDALRYFLLREIVFGQDGSFSFDALVQRYNADLANGLGNLASRTLTMIARYFKGEVPYPSRAGSRAEETRYRRHCPPDDRGVQFVVRAAPVVPGSGSGLGPGRGGRQIYCRESTLGIGRKAGR